MKFSTTTQVVALLSSVLTVDAFWRMPCRYRSGLARIDPLMNPGTLGTHEHAIHGSSAFSETSTTADLLTGDCTSCQVSQDKSAYWTPSLYFQNAATGEFQIVEQVGGMLAYYLLYPNAGNDSLSAFPSGFQMISGSANRRNFTAGPVPDPPKSDWTAAESTQDALAQKALGFNCLNYAVAAEGSLYRHFLPDKAYLDANCLDGIRLELMFPSCWNGVDIDSANHKDHVAFPNLVMTGTCPDTHPVRLVSLFYETIFNTYAFAGVDGQFVLSNGDPTGYGYHGDFIMGWDESFLQEAVDTCTNASGEISDCALFTIQEGSNCNISMPSALANENYIGPMATLPGSVAIQSGPNSATDGATASATSGAVTTGSAVVPTLSHSAGSTIASTDTFLPGGVFKGQASSSFDPSSSSSIPSSSIPSSSSILSSSSPSSSAPATTTAPVYSPAASATQDFVATSYSTSGAEVLEVLWVEETVTVTLSAVETATPYVRRSDRKRAAARHLHRHQHVAGHGH
ncbi:hypothetical protein BP6252_02458 [Coleophoma cylindrospora]|uniref:DUF1996 domain-containing protein n=1 Tax=Coleophoma cylindrospora TaxID=1849047 RepID=A0A3D8SGI0_9HELO|nr:hypothetical protein BP6252_02458 [Coleophoma cylindrospora]